MSPGAIDKTVVRRHLLALDSAVCHLRTHAGKTADELRADRDALWVAERGLQLCAQNCLDIATHIAAGRGLDTPDYASAIDHLAALGVIPAEFAARFRGIAGFRNVLVHGYVEVDIDRLHRLLANHLDDFATFAGHVDAYLDREVS